MALSGKILRSQLNLLKPFVSGCSLETARAWQDRLGELKFRSNKKDVGIKEYRFENFRGAMLSPKGTLRDGVILYLHGGGYTCGGLEYAMGFGSTLAIESRIPVFCAEYRLAPESPFPAALDDALFAYRFLMQSGYRTDRIFLCGESAGGGLIYSLCLKLKELHIPMPCGLIALSPWTDLTASGESYEANKEADPFMTKERLAFFADSYTDNKEDPLVSPLFGDLSLFPPSLIFAGEDEIMLDDSRLMHEALLRHGCRSELVVKKGMWHGYLLFGLKENRDDFVRINEFLKEKLPFERKLRWMKLDNAAKIYPASRRRDWNNVFRLSATLKEPVDKVVLQSALDVTARRFPSISVGLHRGMFWYYLEELPEAPAVSDELSLPLATFSNKELKKCAFRVLFFEKRISVEFFHALTDANGGMVFLKSLVAEYLQQKHGIEIPCEKGVLDRREEPKEYELEDSFMRQDGEVAKSRSEKDSYKLHGTPTPDGFMNITTLKIKTEDMLKAAHEMGVTLTTYLAAATVFAILQIQNEEHPRIRKQKPVKVLIPVNLRPLFDSKTLRNFVLYVTPGVDPKMGNWEFSEICKAIHHQLSMETTKKEMLSRIITNVRSERSPILKIMPLFIKNAAMKLVFKLVGERKSCLTLSNIGRIDIPDVMKEYVSRLDFVIGKQSDIPYTCGVLSYEGTLYINFLRTIKESELERRLFSVLRSQGIGAVAESNMRR